VGIASTASIPSRSTIIFISRRNQNALLRAQVQTLTLGANLAKKAGRLRLIREDLSDRHSQPPLPRLRRHRT
jgi:hypothetical protein